MSEVRSYLTLKRAAQTLGVHEQTLRSWEKRGLIHMVRLPGSGYRRVPIEEIERLQNQMASTRTDPEVRIDPPPQDSQSLAEAQRLADKVCAELADLEYETTLDKYMTTVRGRAWLS